MSDDHDPDTASTELSEAERVANWRFEQALEQGLSAGDAKKFAESDGDLHRLVALIVAGCPPAVAAKIV